MAYVSSANLTGASATSAAVPVPAGAAAGHIAVVGLYLETSAALTPPDGTWTLKADLATGTPSTVGRLAVYWKRLTAADSGTWSWSWTGAGWRIGSSVLFSGRAATGDPFEGTPGTAETTGAGNIVIPAVSPAAAGDDLVAFATNFTGGAWTPGSGLTDAVAAGTTGTKTFTCAGGAAGMKGFLGPLLPAVGDAGPQTVPMFLPALSYDPLQLATVFPMRPWQRRFQWVGQPWLNSDDAVTAAVRPRAATASTAAPARPSGRPRAPSGPSRPRSAGGASPPARGRSPQPCRSPARRCTAYTTRSRPSGSRPAAARPRAATVCSPGSARPCGPWRPRCRRG